MPTYSLLTTVGKNKEAAALANGVPLTISHIAFGDADYAPTGGETSLRNEIVRKSVQASGLVDGAPNAAFFDILLEADDGPFAIHEGGLFDENGDMVAILKYDPPVNKPIPTSGQTVEALLRAHVVFSDLENLVLRIDALNANVSAERQINTDDGIDGGGDLRQDRTHKLAFQNLETITAAQFKDTDEDRDWLALYDSSAEKHKKISKGELSKSLGIDGLVIPAFASVSETIAGEIDSKKTHPAGVKAAIDKSRETAPIFFFSMM